ncbi:MAG: TrbC/VirB2 family protein [Sulfurimonas sp.]|jgi:hypothetical protein|uniref:TrbC/VirB2 family protein n=1 Tax=Sulfurimonas sp. TaxID=2022749 RepID=UPI00356A493F
MKKLSLIKIMFTILPAAAVAEGLDKVNTLMEKVVSLLHGMAILTATAAFMWAGYRYLFGHRTAQDLWPVIAGALLIAAAAELAAFLLS